MFEVLYIGLSTSHDACGERDAALIKYDTDFEEKLMRAEMDVSEFGMRSNKRTLYLSGTIFFSR